MSCNYPKCQTTAGCNGDCSRQIQPNTRAAAAALCRQLIHEKPFCDQQWARLALGVAARAIVRGRLLTSKEKLENLRRALAEDGDAIMAATTDDMAKDAT